MRGALHGALVCAVPVWDAEGKDRFQLMFDNPTGQALHARMRCRHC